MNGSQNLTFTDSTVTVVRQGPDDINSVMLKEKFWTPRLWTRKLIFLGVPILHPNLPEVRSHLFLHHFLIYLSRRSAASSSPWIFSLASVDEPFNSSLHRCFAELGSHLELVSHTWWGWFDLTFCMTWDFCWYLLFFVLFFQNDICPPWLCVDGMFECKARQGFGISGISGLKSPGQEFSGWTFLDWTLGAK